MLVNAISASSNQADKETNSALCSGNIYAQHFRRKEGAEVAQDGRLAAAPAAVQDDSRSFGKHHLPCDLASDSIARHKSFLLAVHRGAGAKYLLERWNHHQYSSWLATRGKSRAALRADLFRQLCVAESAKYSSMTVVQRLDPTNNLSLSHATDFHHGLLGLLRKGAGIA